MSRMMDPDDPRLTAYALGELDATERAEVARLLAESPAAQMAVAEIEQTVALLEARLGAEPCPELTSSQRGLIEQARQAHASPEETVMLTLAREAVPAKRWYAVRRWMQLGALGLAASVIAALLLPSINASREASRRSGLARSDSVVLQNEVQDLSVRGRLNELEELKEGLPEQASGAGGYVVGKPVRELKRQVGQGIQPASQQNGVASVELWSFGVPLSGELAADRYVRRSLGRREDESLYFQSDVAGASVLTEPEYKVRVAEVQAELTKELTELQLSRSVLTEGEKASDDVKQAQARVEQLARKLSDLRRYAESDQLALVRQQQEQSNTEAYAPVEDNPFLGVTQNPLSTFSIDVDTASYSNVRRFLKGGQLPQPAAVRIEELLNYFPYEYTPPEDGVPFAVHTEVAECPWQPSHRLLRVALKGREIPVEARPNSNLVFLIDVSGSMQDANKLSLVKTGLRMMAGQLRESDRVAMVVYAGSSGLVLDSTTGDQQETILAAIDRLEAGGSTNGAAGIQQAYDVAAAHLIKEGTNRVILATDGDFNVGVTSQGELVRLIEEQAKSGVYLTVLGFGMGNYKDATLEQLADKGNGNYAYVDTEREAHKVLVEQLSGTLVTIAKDVKLQLEFNPVLVQAYRLIGYENRLLAKEDFQDDTKDAGEIGAGHTVTALYELVPAGEEAKVERPVAGLEFQTVAEPTEAAKTSGNLLALKLRYKLPDKDTSEPELKVGVTDSQQSFSQATKDFQFAAAVAGFGMLLRHSDYAGTASLASVHEIAQSAVGSDLGGYRRELVELIEAARKLTAEPTTVTPATPE